MTEPHEGHLGKSHLVVYLVEDPQYKPTEAEGPSEEWWEVVEDQGMILMTEDTLRSIVSSIAGFRDYTIVPAPKEGEQT